MATTAFVATDTEYKLITTGDALVQNKSRWPMFVHFGDSLPAVDTEDHHVLEQGEAIQKHGDVPAGGIYVLGGRYEVGGVYSPA